MNIAVFSHYFSPEIGAPSARVHELSREWLGQGHAVQVVTCFPNHPNGKIYPGYHQRRYACEMVDGIKIHRHWTYVTPNKGFFKKTLGHISYLPSAIAFTQRKLDKPDVTIGTSPTFFAAMAARRAAARKVPFIMEVLDLWPAAFVELGVLRNPTLISLLEKWELSLYRSAQKIVTVSEAFRSNLISRGIPAGKVKTVTNGADIDFWKPVAVGPEIIRRLGAEGKFTILYTGAHGISQALSQVLGAARLLKNDSRFLFLMVGDGAEKSALQQQAASEGLPNVTFHEPVDKETLRQYYSLADVCLVPLRNIPIFKTFIPSKMFEIMAMERPIVGSVEGEAADILERSGGAMVVKPEDAKALAPALRALADNPQKRGELGRQGRRFVVDNYSRRALARRYLQIIDETKAEFETRG
jgi:glycosyltransferase involved in cell wall biosynthesis